ncbi:MAG: radical SAM protein [Bdellovibrionales bacterium]|nr:radical SAM protein [Bdellovibrionales bacterium]
MSRPDAEIKEDLHLELTSKCALKCPACPRTERFGDYTVTELSLDALKNILDFDYKYKIVSLCGDHGDPIYHSQFHNVIELLLDLPGAPSLHIATNGSGRKADWWKATAELLRPKDRVIFGIDGLEDTNELYRRGANWQSIMTAAKTLKASGNSQLVWQWILFEHNQHQMPEARKVFEDVRFDDFWVVQSFRSSDTSCKPATITIDEAKMRFQNG